MDSVPAHNFPFRISKNLAIGEVFMRFIKRLSLFRLDSGRQRSVTLRPSIPEEEIPILADSDRLYRVFQNLIGNALKYSLSAFSPII